jgi:hypothetical protein
MTIRCQVLSGRPRLQTRIAALRSDQEVVPWYIYLRLVCTSQKANSVLGEGGTERIVPVVAAGSATAPRAGKAEDTGNKARRELLGGVEAGVAAGAAIL